MAVGASQPTIVGTKDGRIGMKTQMQVRLQSFLFNKSFLLYMCILLTNNSLLATFFSR